MRGNPDRAVAACPLKSSCPDRSLAEAIWVIIAVNEAHAVLKFHCGGPTPHDSASATRIVPLQEYEFYRADHLVAALDAARHQQQSATVVRIRDW
jgi:hypothetical protein